MPYTEIIISDWQLNKKLPPEISQKPKTIANKEFK